MQNATIWIAGDIDHAEFAEATDWLKKHFRWVRSESARGMLIAEESKMPPAAIVLAATRPGQIQAQEVEQLHRREPLATIVGLLGSLCEGEVRSGRPWPGVERIYWHQWQSRLPSALGIAADQKPNAKRPARTWNEMDALQHRSFVPTAQRKGALIAICTGRLAVYESLSDACAAAGYRSLWQLPHLPLQGRGIDLMVVDGEHSSALESGSFESLPRVHLLDFPRLEDYQRTIASGAAAVISKPFHLADLLSGIATALASRAPASQHAAA